jgi:hypothetical protein
VHEQVCDYFPHLKSLNHIRWDEGKISKKGFDEAEAEDEADQENADVCDKQPLYADWESIGGDISIHVGTRTRGHQLAGILNLRISNHSRLKEQRNDVLLKTGEADARSFAEKRVKTERVALKLFSSGVAFQDAGGDVNQDRNSQPH